jgi:hypothetical protein
LNRWVATNIHLDQREEPHSFPGFKVTFSRLMIYIDTLKRVSLNLIGLEFRFPLLLHPNSSWRSSGEINMIIENKKWKDKERDIVIIVGIPSLTSWFFISRKYEEMDS